MANGLRTKNFLVRPGQKTLKFRDWPTRVGDVYGSDEDYEQKLGKLRKALFDQQERLYIDGSHGLIVILQGMDASGKDGIIKHVISGLNPQGVVVNSFSAPSEEELRHDFLWRIHKSLPPRGKVGVLNRSHYEEVLAVRVHPEFLAKQRLPGPPTKDFWQSRFDDINAHEAYLSRQGYRIIKFFLHMSKAEQKERLLARIHDPEKNWKIEPSDIKDHGHWNAYQKAYADCLAATSSREAPWYAVPADDKKNARLIVATILTEMLETIPVTSRKLDPNRRSELKKAESVLRKS